MSQSIQCPQCGLSGEVPAGLLPDEGLTCPKCNAVFVPLPPGWFEAPQPERETTSGVESRRFQTYVAQELGKLERTRHELVEVESRAERQVLAKKMELNHVAAALAARTNDVARREREHADKSAHLDVKELDLNARESAIASRESLRTKLEAEAASLGRLVAELRPAVERLQLRKAEAEAIRTDLADRQKALDRRMVEVGRMELALQNRLDELDELEATLRSELETRERDLERQRRALDEEARASRSHAGVNIATPPPRVWRES